MNLFTYGTLMDADIMTQVSGAIFQSQKATLLHYIRKTVRGEIYPAITMQRGNSTAGIIYFNLSLEAFDRLDKFEGNIYSRTKVEAICDNGEIVDTHAYVITETSAHQLSEEDWSYENFIKNHKQVFQRDYNGYNELE